jgi:putative nucleotidyltransferase with HDIG domain
MTPPRAFLAASAVVFAGAVLVLSSALAQEPTQGWPEIGTRDVWVAVAGVLGIAWLAVAILGLASFWWSGRRDEQRLDHSRELAESGRRLEETLLATVETLNAAVEARDPYTAGHSQRVKRVALAIGRELGLSARQLDILGTAGAFHDIGKIGMPDAILTKPDTLSRSESALMREHVTRGAELISRIASFGDSVPAVRHHHERWDGRGYPDGLAGTKIPVEAAIVALADAWDAMVTDRPYRPALQLGEALSEIRAGRGLQFNPAVVDAFLTVAKRQPADVLPGDESLPYAAVVVA